MLLYSVYPSPLLCQFVLFEEGEDHAAKGPDRQVQEGVDAAKEQCPSRGKENVAQVHRVFDLAIDTRCHQVSLLAQHGMDQGNLGWWSRGNISGGSR